MAENVTSRHAEWADRRRLRAFDWARNVAERRGTWRKRNAYYYDDEQKFLKFLIRPDSRVLEIGCATGDLLARLEPKFGAGVDISPDMIRVARDSYRSLDFFVGDVQSLPVEIKESGPFDFIILADTIGFFEDVQTSFEQIRSLTEPSSRIVISYFSQAWKPLLKIAELMRLKMPQPPQSWLSPSSIENLLDLAGFEVIRRDWRLLIPRKMFGLGRIVNITVGQLPGFRRLSLKSYVVARPKPRIVQPSPSLSIVIPCRNEAGNIFPALQRLPNFDAPLEIIFVEGHSSDNTQEQILRAIEEFPDLDIRFLTQPGRGKADAVRTAFDAAKNDVLMILDADLTVAPEDLIKFYEVIASGKADYVHGTRLVYPIEDGSMRPLNFVANHTFARIFTWLLNQRITDTLCGTKVISAKNYALLKEGRSYFGEFDPFGDFDLIFGAAKLNLKIVELPVRYADRSYGSTQISRFKDGLLLLKMTVFGYKKLKAV